jgi:hypothetical protein
VLQAPGLFGVEGMVPTLSPGNSGLDKLLSVMPTIYFYIDQMQRMFYRARFGIGGDFILPPKFGTG